MRHTVAIICQDYTDIRESNIAATENGATVLVLAAALRDLAGSPALQNDSSDYRELHVLGLDGVAESLRNIAEMIDLHGGS